MDEQIVRIPVDMLKEFICEVFMRCGIPNDDANICTEVLITSDLHGIESHGIGRLKMYYERLKNKLQNPITNINIIKESQTTSVIDGNHGMGMVIGFKSMNIAIQKARQFGIGAVAVRNSTHFGIDGFYALMAAKEGMIGMSFTNARPCVAPTFGTQPTLGTNPIAFSAPTDEECPFLYDAATSITQRGKIEVLDRAEKTTPEGWVISKDAKTMTNPNDILSKIPNQEAALLPLGGEGEILGGHKGYGLSTIVEILSSALQSGAFLFQLSGYDDKGKATHFRVGHFFMAINIVNFAPLDVFRKNIGDILRSLRASLKSPGKSRIYTAGEKEFEMRKFIHENGVPVNRKLENDIKYLQEELNLKNYNFWA
ncbi:MAG TPA: Ldh family oxidoreductase [Anaerolineae bacterium]|nr:Ldh family oxidoreductase [Anaerolineae bacterium]